MGRLRGPSRRDYISRHAPREPRPRFPQRREPKAASNDWSQPAERRVGLARRSLIGGRSRNGEAAGRHGECGRERPRPAGPGSSRYRGGFGAQSRPGASAEPPGRVPAASWGFPGSGGVGTWEQRPGRGVRAGAAGRRPRERPFPPPWLFRGSPVPSVGGAAAARSLTRG